MRKWLRRLRGTIGMGLTWAAAWAPIGALIGLIVGTAAGLGPGALVGRWVGTLAVLGFIGGGIFSSVLWITEGRRRFDELSLPRFTIWGALGGLALGGVAILGGILGAGLSFMDVIIAGASTVLGAGSAAATLAVARGADDRALLDAHRSVADIGLTDRERRELLGTTDPVA